MGIIYTRLHSDKIIHIKHYNMATEFLPKFSIRCFFKIFDSHNPLSVVPHHGSVIMTSLPARNSFFFLHDSEVVSVNIETHGYCRALEK